MTLPRMALLAAALLVAAGGCTSGDTPAAGPSTSASVSRSPSPSASTSAAPVVPPAPQGGACYRLTVTQLTRPTNGSHPVSCGSRHDAQTVFVGRLHTVVDGHALGVDSTAVQHQLERTCPAKLADYLGGTTATRDLTRFRVVWFSPTVAQSDRGADWFRCDVVAFARGDTLFPLPRPGRLHKILDRGTALGTYGLCGSAAPGSKGFERVICAKPHAWQAFTTIPLNGGKKYPGVAAVRSAGDGACKARARERSSNALKFSYGWEWPTAKQWATGQHYGFCWAPD